MWLFRNGKPSLVMWTCHLACLLVPFSCLILDWGHNPVWRMNIIPQAGAWIIAFWAMAITDVAIEFVCLMVDRYIQITDGRESAIAENQILRGEKLEQ
jgi:hypothetical protein